MCKVRNSIERELYHGLQYVLFGPSFPTSSTDRSSDKKYHVEHFTCSICPTLFGPQDSYYEHDSDVYCHYHYSTRFATKCAGCNTAILKQFVEINRNMRDECWHPECYMINKVCRRLILTGVVYAEHVSISFGMSRSSLVDQLVRLHRIQTSASHRISGKSRGKRH
jgi:LIM domain